MFSAIKPIHPIQAIKTLSSFLSFSGYPYTNGMSEEKLLEKLRDDGQWGSWSPERSKEQNTGVLMSVLEALERFPENQEMQHHGLKSVLTFSSHPEYVLPLGKKFSLFARPHDPMDHLTFTKILLALTADESVARSATGDDLFKVVSEVVSIVGKSAGNREAQVNGVTLLNRLVRARPECGDVVISCNPSGIELLANVIGPLSDNPVSFSACTQLLEKLLVDEGMCTVFFTNGGYKAVLNTLEANLDEEYILSGALDILLKTLSLGYYRQSITPFTGHAINVAVSDRKTAPLVEKAANYILHVSLHSAFVETKDLPSNEVDAIVTSIGRHRDNENILIYGALTLNNIIRKAPNRTEEIADKGAYEALFSGMRRHIGSETVQYICAMVLSSVATYGGAGLATPERMGIVRECLNAHGENAKVQMAFFGLLGRIAVNGGEEAKITIAREVDCVNIVSGLLARRNRDKNLLLSGLVFLKRVFSSGKAANIIREGSNDSIRRLCESLGDYNLDPGVKIQLCRALSMLAQNHILCHTMNISGITQKVCNLLNRVTMPDIACSCCELLCVLYGNSTDEMLEANEDRIFYSLKLMNPGRSEEMASICYELISVLIEEGKERTSGAFLWKYGLSKLLDDMGTFKGSRPVQKFCCKALLHILMYSREAVNRQGGGLQKILDAVIPALNEENNASDSGIQTYGLNILVLASEIQPIKINVEGIEKIMATHRKDPLIQELGCDLLERVRGFVPQAISAILIAFYTYTDSESVQKYCMLALNTALRNGIEVADPECVDYVIAAMLRFPENYQIQMLGLLILYRLISSKPELIRHKGLIDTVLKAFAAHSSGEAIYVKLHIIEKMAFLDRESAKVILDGNGIYNMVNLVSINRYSGKMKFLVLGLYALASFALDEGICDYLFREKEALYILNFLRTDKACQDVDLFVWGFLAMGRLAYHSARFRASFIEDGFHHFIARVMADASEYSEEDKKNVFQTGCFALANIVYNYPTKSSDGDVVAAITAAIKSYFCPVIQICGCSALYNLCENVCSHRTAIDSRKFLDAVFECMKSRSKEVQLLAVKTLGLLWTISGLRAPIAARGGVKAVLKIARENYETNMLRSAPIRVLALMTYQCDPFSDRRVHSTKMKNVLSYIKRREGRGDEATLDKENIFANEGFIRSLLEAGSLAIKVLGEGCYANSSEVEDSLTILWNIAPHYSVKDKLCENELQVLMTQGLRNEEYLKYVFCILGVIAPLNPEYLPLTYIIGEASSKSVESKLYALRILESAQCIPKGLENMRDCVTHLSGIFRAHPTLRLPVMRVFNNFVYVFSDEACEPVAEELIEMLPDLSSRCGATQAFVEYYFRTLMWALSDDEIREKVFSEGAKAAVSKLHAQYGGASATVDKCFKAVMRVEPPELEFSLQKEICTCNAIKLCERCPAKTSGRFCPRCCCQQEMYVCEKCKHPSGMKKKFCASCWKKTHHIGSGNESHAYKKRFIAATCDIMKLQLSSSSIDDF